MRKRHGLPYGLSREYNVILFNLRTGGTYILAGSFLWFMTLCVHFSSDNSAVVLNTNTSSNYRRDGSQTPCRWICGGIHLDYIIILETAFLVCTKLMRNPVCS